MDNLDLLEASFDDFLDTYLPVIDEYKQPPPQNRLPREETEVIFESFSSRNGQRDTLKTFVGLYT